MYRFRTFMIIAGLLGMIFGLGLLFAPGIILDMNGARTDATGLMMSRFCGAVLVEAGLLQVMVCGCQELHTQKLALIAGLTGAVIGAVLTAWMPLSGITGPMGWGNFAVYVFLLVGFVLTLRNVDSRVGDTGA